jgi:hypothetical protein
LNDEADTPNRAMPEFEAPRAAAAAASASSAPAPAAPAKPATPARTTVPRWP